MIETYETWMEKTNVLFWVDGEEYVFYGENRCFVWTDCSNNDQSTDNSLSRLALRVRNEQSEYGVNPAPLWNGWRNLELSMRAIFGDEAFESFMSIGASA